MKHEDTSISYALFSASACIALRDVSSTWPVMHLQVSTRINPGWLTSISRAMGHLVGCLSAGFASHNGNVYHVMGRVSLQFSVSGFKNDFGQTSINLIMFNLQIFV